MPAFELAACQNLTQAELAKLKAYIMAEWLPENDKGKLAELLRLSLEIVDKNQHGGTANEENNL